MTSYLAIQRHGEDYVVWLKPQRLGICMQGGPGLEKALAEFGSYVEDLGEALVKNEEKLGPAPTEQLAALRAAGMLVGENG